MRPRPKRRPLLVLPISRLFPNMVTIGGLCCGLTAMRFALDGKFETSVTLLVASAIIDGLDGRIARFLNSTSMFGAQLDSLSDFVCFGVAPAMTLYLWSLKDMKSIGWALALFFVVCCALRLARFNTNLTEEHQPWQMKFFTGIPSPAGAMLSLMPLVGSFFFDSPVSPAACGIWMGSVAALMASRIPTFAMKQFRIRHEWVLPVMLIGGVIIVAVMNAPWQMFEVAGIVYALTLPLSIRRYHKLASIYRRIPVSQTTEAVD